jgi:hypothetical protein
MKRLSLMVLSIALLMGASPAAADWRWAPPRPKKHKVTYSCDTMKCIRQTYHKEKRRYKHRIARHNKRRLHEWKHWTHLYIPACTWYGESGYGPKYARYRYTMPNSDWLRGLREIPVHAFDVSHPSQVPRLVPAGSGDRRPSRVLGPRHRALDELPLGER